MVPTNIRKSIVDFDDDEKGVTTGYTLGGQQNIACLTELGLYRLLGQSRLPIARPFQKWVATVLRDIRQKGRYELQEALANKDATIQLARLALESEREIITKALTDATKTHADATAASHLALENERESTAKALAVAATELEHFRTKTYEEIPKHDHVYINKEVAELNSDRHKLGKALDEKRREAQFNTGSAQGRRNIIYARETHNGKLVEDMAKAALKRYHIGNFGGTENYNCKSEHTANVFDIACVVCDTLASSFEFITRDELIDRLVSKLEDERDASHAVPMPPASEPDIPSDPLQGVISSTLHEFLQMDEIERGCRISKVDGGITWVHDFEAAFEEKMRCDFLSDPATFSKFGYKLSAKEEHVCKVCKKLARAGCCAMYDATKRGKKKVIYDMAIARIGGGV